VANYPALKTISSAEKINRSSDRRRVAVPGRLTWRDKRGMPRFATVVTRDISENGVYLECRGADAIPMYHLVFLQLERDARDVPGIPAALKEGRVLSAIYRVGPCEPSTGTPSGYGLKLLVEPTARLAEQTRAVRSMAIA
jgi:hypothetical protein